MIHYKIRKNKDGSGFDHDFPLLKFTNEKYSMLQELNRCDADYIIDEVLPNLGKVLSGDLKNYEFGFEATLIDFYEEKATINYNYGDNQLEIGSQPIYEFMLCWRNALVEWKKNHGNLK
jgi:hypothetical protein